jgi:hypothetical protein
MNPMPRCPTRLLLTLAALLGAAPAVAQAPPAGFADPALPPSPLRQIIRMQLENRAPAPLAGVPGSEAGRLLGSRAEGGRGAAPAAAPEGFGAEPVSGTAPAAAPGGWR